MPKIKPAIIVPYQEYLRLTDAVEELKRLKNIHSRCGQLSGKGENPELLPEENQEGRGASYANPYTTGPRSDQPASGAPEKKDFVPLIPKIPFSDTIYPPEVDQGFRENFISKNKILAKIPKKYQQRVRHLLNVLEKSNYIEFDSSGNIKRNELTTNINIRDLCPFLFESVGPETYPEEYAGILHDFKKQLAAVEVEKSKYQTGSGSCSCSCQKKQSAAETLDEEQQGTGTTPWYYIRGFVTNLE